MRRMFHPVVGPTRWGMGPVAWFSDYGDAVDYITSHKDRNCLFLGVPEYADEVEIVELEAKPLGDGKWGIAA